MRLVNLYVRSENVARRPSPAHGRGAHSNLIFTSLLAFSLLAASGCQSAQKPASLLPPHAAPPAPEWRSASATASRPQQPPAQAQTQDDAPAQKSAPVESAASITPIPDPVADLVSRAESQYQSGLANYRAGKSDEARQNFDQALNAL